MYITTFRLLTSLQVCKKTELGYPAAAADSDKTALGNVLDRLLVDSVIGIGGFRWSDVGTWLSKYPSPETNIDIAPLKDAWETITILLFFGIRGKFLGLDISELMRDVFEHTFFPISSVGVPLPIGCNRHHQDDITFLGFWEYCSNIYNMVEENIQVESGAFKAMVLLVKIFAHLTYKMMVSKFGISKLPEVFFSGEPCQTLGVYISPFYLVETKLQSLFEIRKFLWPPAMWRTLGLVESPKEKA